MKRATEKIIDYLTDRSIMEMGVKSYDTKRAMKICMETMIETGCVLDEIDKHYNDVKSIFNDVNDVAKGDMSTDKIAHISYFIATKRLLTQKGVNMATDEHMRVYVNGYECKQGEAADCLEKPHIACDSIKSNEPLDLTEAQDNARK